MRPTTVIIYSVCVLLLGILLRFSYVYLPYILRAHEETLKNGQPKQGYTGPPVAKGHAYFTEAFPSRDDFRARWILSKSMKDNNHDMQYDGEWRVEEPWSNPLPNDLGLVLKTKSRHHAVSVMLDEPFIFSDKIFVFQYEVRFQDGQSCGGGYVKLLSQTRELNLADFNDKAPYTIMFGPDTCETDPKIHFIMQHRNPLTGLYEEKRLKESASEIESSYFYDRKTHLYALVIHPNNSFEIYIDQDLHFSGNLLADMSPPINPVKEFPDPEDKKPEDWDDRKLIPDPDAVKPDDWDENEPKMIEDRDDVKPLGWLDDEPYLIPDPKEKIPADWDSRLRGEWEPPRIRNPKCGIGCGQWTPALVTNPKYRGMWQRPMIPNPNYKGEWRPRMLPNKKYFQDLHPYKMRAIAAVGLEIWSMTKNILFDNFILTDSKSVADKWAEDSWVLKRAIEMEESEEKSNGFVRTVVDAADDQPVLWSIIALLIIIPAVILIVFCYVQAYDVCANIEDESMNTEAFGRNGCDAWKGENNDACGVVVNKPGDCKENLNNGMGDKFQKVKESLSCSRF